MKYIVVLLILLAVVFKTNSTEEEEFRVRIIANSNLEYDQMIKQEVKKNILSTLSKVSDDKVEFIVSNPKLIDLVVSDVTEKAGYNYDISYGENYFPTKTIEGIMYPSGHYQSLVITLGSGLGENYWCILYPDAVENGENFEYKIYLFEKLKSYFSNSKNNI
ncbi:stage II sporulation protein R [Mycoplasmatota bacterium zrk1]